MTPSARPAIRLLPKANARAIRHGYPFVYQNELVLDRRTRALAPGTLAVLEDAERRPMGLVAVSPEQRLAARMLDTDSASRPTSQWPITFLSGP